MTDFNACDFLKNMLVPFVLHQVHSLKQLFRLRTLTMLISVTMQVFKIINDVPREKVNSIKLNCAHIEP